MLRFFLIGVVLVFAANTASASTPTPYRLEGIIDNSTHIVIGKIMFGEVALNGERKCARDEIYYNGRLQDVIKGTHKELEFCTRQKLMMGGEYLFFFDGAEGYKLWVALPVTLSHLDTSSKWLEINTLSVITTTEVDVRIEKFTYCGEHADPSPCKIIRARELMLLDDVIDEIRRRTEIE